VGRSERFHREIGEIRRSGDQEDQKLIILPDLSDLPVMSFSLTSLISL
jgi:hypothetical protein